MPPQYNFYSIEAESPLLLKVERGEIFNRHARCGDASCYPTGGNPPAALPTLLRRYRYANTNALAHECDAAVFRMSNASSHRLGGFNQS